MALVMFALSATAYEILGVEKFVTLFLTFRMGQGQIKYTTRKPIGDYLCIGNSNICSICHRL